MQDEPQLAKVFFLKSAVIPRALVIDKGSYIMVSEDNGENWGSIPRNLVQGTVPITDNRRERE
jgi:hypothetical protein